MAAFGDTDVVVLGAGLGGLCAAISAAESGAQVALLEKTASPGGSSRTSGGVFAFGGTDLQNAAGIEDSPEKLVIDFDKATGGTADSQFIRLYARRQIGTYDWLKKQGVNFLGVTGRNHQTDPKQLIEALSNRVRDTRSIQLINGAYAKGLIGSMNEGVNGVQIQHAGREAELKARRGVVIATGGFTRNPALIEKFAPKLRSCPGWGGVGNSGDGLVMAWGLGADFLDMGYINGTFGVVVNHYPDLRVGADDELMLCMSVYLGAILVNLASSRFTDESKPYKSLAQDCLAQKSAIAFQIFDGKVMDQTKAASSMFDFKGLREKGMLRQADSVRSLAELLHLNPDDLDRTIDRYNQGVDSGNDQDFGRSSLNSGAGNRSRIDTPPYFGLPCSTVLTSTPCGLRVDAEMRVLHVSGQPIPRLYAVGEATGGFPSGGAIWGAALGKAAIQGRLAGERAATK